MKTLKEKEMKPDNKKEDNGFYWSKDVKQFIKDIILEIENAQTGCSGSTWISREQAIRIIKIKSGFKV